jgi:naphthalene 1,2-dioxygenase ferredoxin component
MTLMSSVNEDTKQVTISVGVIDELPRGRVAAVVTPSGQRIAVYNVNGELYATEDSCPHQDAPLSDGFLCGHVIECGLHGWQFDVRNGKCLTVEDSIKTFPVAVEDGVIKISVTKQ